MPAKKTANTQVTKLRDQIAQLKKENTSLKAEIKSQKVTLKKHLDEALEEVYTAGYIDAIEDVEAKSIAMEKFMENAAKQFEQSYHKKLTKNAGKKSTTKKKATAAKKTAKAAKKTSSPRKKK